MKRTVTQPFPVVKSLFDISTLREVEDFLIWLCESLKNEAIHKHQETNHVESVFLDISRSLLPQNTVKDNERPLSDLIEFKDDKYPENGHASSSPSQNLIDSFEKACFFVIPIIVSTLRSHTTVQGTWETDDNEFDIPVAIFPLILRRIIFFQENRAIYWREPDIFRSSSGSDGSRPPASIRSVSYAALPGWITKNSSGTDGTVSTGKLRSWVNRYKRHRRR